MATLKLPDRKAFTIEQLAEQWDCELGDVKDYIETGELKRGFDTRLEHTHLRRLRFYKCEADNERLLNNIRNGKALSEFVSPVMQEKVIPCPTYLYMPFMPNSIMSVAMESITLELLFRIFMMPKVMVRYFYDLDGNALIPIENGEDEYRVCFMYVRKHILDSLIPLEEVKRFENKYKKVSGKKTQRKKHIIKIIIEHLKLDPKKIPYETGDNNIKRDVWDAFDEHYEEDDLEPLSRRGAFDNAWGELFYVNEEKTYYVPKEPIERYM